MTRVHHTPGGRASLALGDCVRILDDASPAPFVDAVIADSPYCSGGANVAESARVGKQGKTAASLGWFEGDNMGPAGLAYLLREVCRASLPQLRPDGSIFVFCDWRMVTVAAPACESAGLRLRNIIVWDKGTPSLGYGFRPQHELILHLSHRRSTFHRFDLGNVLRFDRPKRKGKAHPTEKPVDLLSALIEVATPAAGVVLDPFAGSASTGEAALRLGRSFFGIERDERFWGPACDRLDRLDPAAAAAA